MKKIGTLLIYIWMLLLLTGCWNSKDIQKMAYVTALGLDYKDGKYITYVQVLNFANVAKTETSELGKSVPIWIGKGEGATVTESFNSIYSTSQIRVFWGHVKAIVSSENLLNNPEKLKEAYDMINRYREVRYNILLYGTKEPLQEIFVQKSILNFSPLDTIMYTPAQIYSQRSFILPVYGYKIIAQFNEPGKPAMLPSISIDRGSWSEDNTAKKLLKIDGAYFFHKMGLAGWLNEDDLRGYRWVQKRLERSPINIPNNKKTTAAIVMIHPKPKIQPVFKEGAVYFELSLDIQAYVDELIKTTSEKSIEESAAKALKDEIMFTYKKGLSIQSDVLKLDQALYRDYPEKWHEYHRDNDFILKENSLSQIRVKVHLLHTGKYKGKTD